MASDKLLRFYAEPSLPTELTPELDGIYFIKEPSNPEGDFELALVVHGEVVRQDVISKEILSLYQDEVTQELNLRALASDVYTKSQTYTKTEVNDKVNLIGASQFQGTAVPATPAPEPTVGDSWWIANVAGTYTNLGGVVVPEGEFGIITKINDGTGDVYEVSTAPLPVQAADGQVVEGDDSATSGDTVYKGTIKPSDLTTTPSSTQIADVNNNVDTNVYVGTTANDGLMSTTAPWKVVLVPLINGEDDYHIQGWNTVTKTIAFYSGNIPSSIAELPVEDNSNLIVSDRSSNLSSLGMNDTPDTDFTKPIGATYLIATIVNGNSETDTVFSDFMVSVGFGEKTKDEYKAPAISKIKDSTIAAKLITDKDNKQLTLEEVKEDLVTDKDLDVTQSDNLFNTDNILNDTFVSTGVDYGVLAASGWKSVVLPKPDVEPVGKLVIQNWNTLTQTIAFLSSAVEVGNSDNVIWSGRINDYTGNFEIDGSSVIVEYPVGTKEIVVNIKRDVESDSIYEEFMLLFGSDYVPYSPPFTALTKVKGYDIAPEYIKVGDSVISTSNININTIAKDVTVAIEGVNVAIRIPFDDTQDFVHRWERYNANGVFNSRGVYSIPKNQNNDNLFTAGQGVHVFNDNIAPIFFKNLITATGNHGVALPLGTVSTGHDKTQDDLFSIWEDASNQFYLVEIVSSTQLRFLPLERADRTIGRSISSTLTHVSGAVNTSDIVTTSRTAVEVKPAVRDDVFQKIILDGVEIVEDGIYSGKLVRLEEISNVPDYRKPTLVAPFDVTDAPIMIQQRITYSYDKTNTLYIDYVMDDRGNFPIAYNGFFQSGVFSTNASLGTTKNEIYFPNSNVYIGQDFRQLVDLTSPIGIDVLINDTDNENPDKPVQRAIQIASNAGTPVYGYAHGYAYNIGKSSVANRKDLYRQWELRGHSGKSYPRVLWDYDLNYEVLHVSAYCQYFDPKLNPEATSVYVHKEEGADFIYIDFHNAFDKVVINLPSELHNKNIEIVDSQGVSILGGNNIPVSGLNISVVLQNGYAYAVLKTVS